MKETVPNLILKEKKAMKRRKIKKGEKRQTPRMEKTNELIKDGYSIKKALELAGYSQSTINSRYRQYLERLDLPELLRGLKQGSALLNYKAMKVLDEEMDKENSRERIRLPMWLLRMISCTSLTRRPPRRKLCSSCKRFRAMR